MLAYILATIYMYLDCINFLKFLSLKLFTVKSCYLIKLLFSIGYWEENKCLHKTKKVENSIKNILSY